MWGFRQVYPRPASWRHSSTLVPGFLSSLASPSSSHSPIIPGLRSCFPIEYLNGPCDPRTARTVAPDAADYSRFRGTPKYFSHLPSCSHPFLQTERPRVMVKDSSQYSPVDAVDNDEEKLFGDAESFRVEPHPKLHSILRVWPMLSHGALICTSLLFFALWMRTPSPHLYDDIPVYCKEQTILGQSAFSVDDLL
jgi:hypothetical protein